jgi:two-component system, NarL family, sensor kinase
VPRRVKGPSSFHGRDEVSVDGDRPGTPASAFTSRQRSGQMMREHGVVAEKEPQSMRTARSLRPGDLVERVSVRRVVGRFALAGLLALGLVVALTAWASRRVGTEQAIADAQRVNRVSLEGIIEPVLDDGLLTADADALERLDAAVRESVLRGSLVRVKLWAADGTVLYADEPRLIGQRFELDEGALATLNGGPPNAEVSDLSKPENQYEAEAKLLEVYSGTALPNGTPVLFETYFLYSGVTDVGRRLWLDFAPIAIGALVVLQLIQVPLAWSMARRLDTSQTERERLLRQAIAASEAERRRIASDLHDGVVQDLTGVSLRLAALGRGAELSTNDALDASASIRTSIKSLRSLLVEIYPPNLQEEGLESALGDLLGRVGARGITTDLDVQLGDIDLDPDTAALLYRTAQEALRNIVTHANASRVRIDVHLVNGIVAMSVDDDGRGFSTAEFSNRSADGHVGLKSLSHLASELGGQLTVRSSSGVGTHLFIELPAPVRPQHAKPTRAERSAAGVRT